MDYSRHVQKVNDRLYIIATWNEASGQYLAPMNLQARQATGCHTAYARRVEDIDPNNCYTYKTRQGAINAAERLANRSD